MMQEKIKVLMVCLGNICRSPTAEGVFREEVRRRCLHDYIEVDSAGTSSWHHQEPPDTRATRAALKRGIDLSTLKGRQITAADIDMFDYVFAMDEANYNHLLSICPTGCEYKVSLMLTFPNLEMEHEYGHDGYREVPDPYYSGEESFELVLNLVEAASARILDYLAERHKLGKVNKGQSPLGRDLDKGQSR